MKVPEQNQMLLSIACLLGLSLSSSKPYASLGGRCDQENEYYDGNLNVCCSKCPPGQYALRRCTRQSDTLCAVCRVGEFTEFWNYVRECQICPSCDHRRGLVVRLNCSSQRKTQCECAQGLHCVEGMHCSECEAHTVCPPGQEVAQQVCNSLPVII
ncbi:tumor necrosis factor receptor superfamily member 3-like [Cetorhinus maximus]